MVKKIYLALILGIFLLGLGSAGVLTDGTITTDGDYTIVKFTSNGYFNLSGFNLNAEVLVVGGGGAGGRYYSGGGGAGGYQYNSSFNVTSGNYVIQVGLGGTACATSTGCTGGSGGNSTFSTITAIGGGGGAGSNSGGVAGANGGSGGGAGGTSSAVGGIGVQGNNGGNTTGEGGAGGGGANTIGSNGGGGAGGNGGSGIANSINGTSITYAGGGGGSAGTKGTGGAGGGGAGATDLIPAISGTNGLGGGGGGGSSSQIAGNGGSGVVIIRYLTLTIPSVNLNSPINYYNSSTKTITFNGTISDYAPTNVSFILDGVYNETNTSGILGNYLFNKILSDGTHTWNYESCNSSGFCNNGIQRTLTIDTTLPTLDVLTPNSTINYLKQGDTFYLTGFANDTNLDTVWFEYNGTNTTISGVTTETLFNQSFNQADSSKTSLKVWANDTLGNLNSKTISWGYKLFQNSNTFNSSTYETARESFILNVTANSSLTAVTLDYNGTDYSMTNQGSGIWSKTIDIPEGVSNRTLRYKFTYAGSTIYSDYFYQNVSRLVFTLCNATYNNDFLNISFKDEADLTYINATIPTSTFTYYLGSGTVNKTYTYSNVTNNYYYQFCASPTDKTINIMPYVQFKQGTDYPQRIWQPAVQQYNSTVTSKILYLLSSTDGIYVTFQVQNAAQNSLSDVAVQANRTIESQIVQIASGTTDNAGLVTFWMNPDFSHDFLFSKAGYTTYTSSFAPTQSSYTITLSGGTQITSSYLKGIIYSVIPIADSLVNDTSYTFGFNLTSSYWDVTYYGFSLRLSNGTVIDGGVTGTEGTELTKVVNTSNLTKIYLDYYWTINGTNTTGTKTYKIYNDELSQWSIKTFFTDLNTYLDKGFFGIDNFARYLFIFLTLFISAGIVGYKFGINSPTFISALVFFIIFFFDVGVGIIPEIVIHGNSVPYILTFLSGFTFVILIFNEVFRG